MPETAQPTDKKLFGVAAGGESRAANITGDLKCSRCGATKPHTEFGRKPDGRFKSTCKRCLNAMLAKARERAKPHEDNSHLALDPKRSIAKDDDNFANLDPHTINSAHYYATRQSSLKLANETRWNWEKKDFRRFISSKKLIIRLQYHALGKVDMANSAVRAAIALLDRVVPTLQSVEHKGQVEHRYVLEVPSIALSSAEWEAIDTKLTPALPSPTKATTKSKA